MNYIFNLATIIIVALISIKILDMYFTYSVEALEREYIEAVKEHGAFNCVCPICSKVINISETQRIIYINQSPQLCCITHTNRELVDYYKKTNSEDSQ